MILQINRNQLVLSDKTKDWCRIPYENHPTGCPNFGDQSHRNCPPHSRRITEIIDITKTIFLIASSFDLEEHEKRMKFLHPLWSRKQCRCVLYWQGTLRKKMREESKRLFLFNKIIVECPEGHGVNVYATCRKAGLFLQKIRNLSICHHVAIIGIKL